MSGVTANPDRFIERHIGPNAKDQESMLKAMGYETMEAFLADVIPEGLRTKDELDAPEPISEFETLGRLRGMAEKNRIYRSYLGMGYAGCVLPPVIQRNVLENPGWYTQYTPYQAEIAQGRLEAMLNFQTMVTDLTAMEISNASLLDEATAAAEAMSMCHGACKDDDAAGRIFVSKLCHPQTIEVVRTRADALDLEVIVGDHETFDFSTKVFAALLQYPATEGTVFDYAQFVETAHSAGSLVIVAADLLSLALLKAPGEFGADVVVGSTQRFGMPMGFGGPHAAFLATRDKFKRSLPGRLVGVSKDSAGRPALRLSLQTREQHIRREKATSNICTAQVLPAVVASMYAVYHGPERLRAIAQRVHDLTRLLAAGLKRNGLKVDDSAVFDTLKVELAEEEATAIFGEAERHGINLRRYDADHLTVSLDETVTETDVFQLIEVFHLGRPVDFSLEELLGSFESQPVGLARESGYLGHPVFNTHHSETEMLRYIKKLEGRDLSLTVSMIPLGSCTMKLNATSEMFPVTWREFAALHPFVPSNQAQGYAQLCHELENWLAHATGFAGVSLQPNAGSQGEYAGLLVIAKYLESQGQGHREVCLIPSSAHGTNPASAIMAGMKVVIIKCESNGNIDLADLEAKATEHSENLAACMVTYPSTHGVFEEGIREVCRIVHDHGGQVYMDGANLNAQVGLCQPAELGADVCHINLHKTFCIPHGGGGPGMGPIAVAGHLVSFLPSHPLAEGLGTEASVGPISASPWGSGCILPISWVYMQAMGGTGLTEATKVAILNANYVAHRLEEHFPVLYKGTKDRVAHECILDLRHFKAQCGVEVEDVAKRLMDYGFHAPTMSWPVPATVMVEPTESESLEELDRFCDAMISIREEITEIADGKIDVAKSALRLAPHTSGDVTADDWGRDYSREKAAFPAPWTKEQKFWPPVSRIDNVYGDRNLFCSCLPVEASATS